ncbi:MAG: UvrD-helicase domain-containing protein, partial [Candidatus Puniceispirillaceae bacterium]
MMTDLIHHASAAQAHASDPAASVFVSANAGTGKTKLLTDRVLRLLLAGAPADSILCVTYTRAAAAEMRNRINKRLGDWTIISAKALTEDLKKMGIETPPQDMMQRARSLFAEILDNDNGPRVETVHSFCQTILHRFPIEAGITPHARLADDEEQARLKLQARNNIMAMADSELMNAVQLIVEMANEGRADQILQAFLSQETRLADPQIIKKVIAHFETDLQIPDAKILEIRKREAIDRIDIEGLRAVSAALDASGVETHKRRASQMKVWLAQPPEDRIEKLSFLVDALFTANGPRSERTLSNADIRNALPDAVAIQQAAIDAIAPILCGDNALICKQMTVALYRYGVAFWREYERLKAMRGVLDYDDLINRTNRLLDQSDAAQWVAWKLDNGIQHMLIDEAQDTSPQQWQLLRRLIDDFFAGEGADHHWSQRQHDQQRTVLPARSMFAVGDFKQSIYSFQGADPRVMGDNRQSLATRAIAANKEFRDVALSVSFRSSAPVLQLVNALIPQRPGIEDFSTHEVARDDLSGFVEIWPVVKSAD